MDKFCDDENADYIAYTLHERVLTIVNELRKFDIERAIEIQPKEFARAEIYPNIWINEDRDELHEELKDCFCSMLNFYEKAAALGKAVIVSIY